MAIKQVQISVEDLTSGMFVSKLDRPWAQTPFPLQGFHVRTPQDISSLKAYCSNVYIDITKGKAPLQQGATQTRPSKSAPQYKFLSKSNISQRDDSAAFTPSAIVVRKGVYATSVSLKAEVPRARAIVSHLKGNLTLVSKQISKGKAADYDKLRADVDDMVSSVIRCPDAFTWLIRLRQKDQHTHDHSLRSALWAVQFARFIGMAKDEIAILCMGTLLKDIGKLKVSNAVLRSANRSQEEELEYHSFVEHGVEMLRQSRQVEPRVISVVRYHCERHNGTGFPEGVVGSKIPLLARIAGIATVYDAISTPREAAEPVAPSRAVSLLYNMRGNQFQEDLVVKFIQSIGLYPTGTLVELTTGDIGVVVEQHPQSRLMPQIAVLDQEEATLGGNCLLVDLKDEQETRRILMDSGRERVMSVARVAIARDLEPTGYDVDLTAISALFIQAEVNKKKSFLAGLKGLVAER